MRSLEQTSEILKTRAMLFKQNNAWTSEPQLHYGKISWKLNNSTIYILSRPNGVADRHKVWNSFATLKKRWTRRSHGSLGEETWTFGMKIWPILALYIFWFLKMYNISISVSKMSTLMECGIGTSFIINLLWTLNINLESSILCCIAVEEKNPFGSLTPMETSLLNPPGETIGRKVTITIL